jgi:hypothetical protein
MSLQTLKKKSDATSHTYANIKPFTINGGTRNLSYIGKTMRNSTVKTPFRGTLPMGYAGPGTSIVLAFPQVRAELRSTPSTPQMSVRNTKSMIATKYTWIKGQYPHAWTQPNTNLTSHEHTQHLKTIPTFTEKNTKYSISGCIGTLDPIPVTTTCCTSTTTRPTSVRNILQRNATNSARGTNTSPDTTVNGFSEYMDRLRANTMTKSEEDKPFPFYVNSRCGNTIYTSAPQWYKSAGFLTQIVTNRCTIENANNILNDAIIEAINTATIWSNIQQNDTDTITTTAEETAAENAAVAAQQAARDAAQNVLTLVTQYCEPPEVIQNAQNAFDIEQTLLDELTAP